MELRQLEYFCRIADLGSFHEAARRLNISQPPLSYQVRQLEQELNVRLFDRTSRGVVLTEAGRLLYERASRLLDYAGSTRQEVAAAGKKHILRLGITSSTVPTILPYITAFHRRYPEVSFEVRDAASFTLLQYLLDGMIDISVARTPLRLENVASRTLCTEPMIVASPPGSDLTGEGSTRLADLQQRPLILYRRYEELILGAFRRQGLTAEVFCVCDDARDAMLWVGAGLATAIFPQSMQSLCTGLNVRVLDEPELETQTMLIWKKDVRLPETVQHFLAACTPQETKGEQ